MKHIALYPGSFDPITFGHLDILERATNLFDKVLVTVAVNHRKNAVFSGDERVELIKECLKGKEWAKNVEVDQFTGLLVNHAKKVKANTLIRGVRQISDFRIRIPNGAYQQKISPGSGHRISNAR